jgi:hypothetical protein
VCYLGIYSVCRFLIYVIGIILTFTFLEITSCTAQSKAELGLTSAYLVFSLSRSCSSRWPRKGLYLSVLVSQSKEPDFFLKQICWVYLCIESTLLVFKVVGLNGYTISMTLPLSAKNRLQSKLNSVNLNQFSQQPPHCHSRSDWTTGTIAVVKYCKSHPGHHFQLCASMFTLPTS